MAPGRASALAAGIAAAAALAWSAAAEPAPPPSPEALAQARAAGDSIIAKAGVGDLFQNVTTSASPEIRHLGSGLVCGFGVTPQAWGADDVIVFPSGLPRGDDVGCNARFKGFLVSMDETRFATPPDLDVITAAYVRDIMTLDPKARPYTGEAVEMTAPVGAGFPPFRTARFIFDERGGLYSRLSVAVVRGWVIEERVTGPLADGRLGDLLAGVEMINAIESVCAAGPKTP